MTQSLEYPLASFELSQELERTEALACVEAVKTRAAMQPETGATWIEVAGTYAMFDLPDSPVTQTFGLGMFGVVTDKEFCELEDFFQSRGAAVYHEVSPLVDGITLSALTRRGYQPIEFTNVMYRPIDLNSLPPTSSQSDEIIVRPIAESERLLWAQTSAKGWIEFAEYADMIYDLALLMASRASGGCFLAEIDGQPVATAATSYGERIALLAGASTIPSARHRGAQSALLNARLHEAQQRGCELAMICALPGSPSQRNDQRNGFHIAYTRVKWKKISN